MELTDFETLLHISVAFNFLYSAFENFSKNIGMFFSEPLIDIPKKAITKFSSKVQELQDSRFIENKFYEGKLREKLDQDFIRTSSKVNKFLDPQKFDLEYEQRFKSLYLLTGFYSLLLIILCGFHRYYTGEKLYHALFIVNCIMALVFLYVLLSSFLKKIPKIFPLHTLLIFIVILVTFAVLFNNLIYTKLYDHIPSDNCTIYFSVTLVLAPFFLHAFRIMLQVFYLKGLILIMGRNYRKAFTAMKAKAKELDDAKKLIEDYSG